MPMDRAGIDSAATADSPASVEEDYRLEQQVGFLLRRAHQVATEVFLSEIGDADVTPQQFAVLVTLLARGELPHGALGQATAMDPATLMGVVRRLARRRLIKVRTDPDDGRRRLVRLAPKGEELAEHLRRIGPRISARILEPLADGRPAILLDLLDQVGQPRGKDETSSVGSRNSSKPGLDSD